MINPSRWVRCIPVAGLLLVALSAGAAREVEYGRIELLRDTWGVPHVFSETDAGAMYGLGYTTAEEHGFQMTYSLRIIQGRLSEVIGERRRGNRNETSVDHDRKMRTFGWRRAADRTAKHLNPATLQLLEAYCDGINDSFAAQKKEGRLHPLFGELGVTPEPWTPADCVLSWWHLAQFFATDGTRDLLAWRNRRNPRPAQPPVGGRPQWADDATAVVQRGDVTDEWVKRVEEFAASHLVNDTDDADMGDTEPKFSHAWVVGGKKTTTGAAVLVSDPQTPVRNPSLWIEFHICGKTFDVRGIGVAGSPAVLIGFNRKVAWGLTALGADQADLFRLETKTNHPNQYRWNGKWRKMDLRTERIKVKGSDDLELTVRETHVGPVVSEFCFRRPNDPEVALKRIPMCEPDRDTIQGVLGMMRAGSAAEFSKALNGWRFPSANCLFGDSEGHIGYSVLGAIPVRPKTAPDPQGHEALPGRGDADDWQGFVPQGLVPQAVDPKTGLLFSANHRPVGSFYSIPLGISTGSMGDTIRSWRLRERLRKQDRFTPREVLDVHYDTVNPARREIVRLGLHLRDTGSWGFSEEALMALEALEPWLQDGASSDLNHEGAELATRVSTFFRFVATPLAFTYGGGESGLARFLKDSATRIAEDPEVEFDEDTCVFIDQVLTDAWNAQQESGETRGRIRRSKLGWFETLDGFASLDRSQDVPQPGITCLDGQTLKSQAAQSYTQWVPLDDVDSALTLCPIGHSDRPDSPWRTSTLDLWGAGKLHAAPLSREAVEKITVERAVLSL